MASLKNRNENTNQIVIETLKEKTGEEISEVELDQVDRVGAFKDDTLRPILANFIRCNTRSRVFRNKNKLKGKKVSISESLTKMRMEALRPHCLDLLQKNHVQRYKWQQNQNILRLENKLWKLTANNH